VNHRLRRQDLPCVFPTSPTDRISFYSQRCGKSSPRGHAS
jgi:hypothetical protein